MRKKVIASQSLERIRNIHRLSKTYNKKVRFPHDKRLLELMRHHIVEIEDLFYKKNKHYLIETGDLIVLCCELLLENKADIDKIMLKCFGRYERKLTGLIKERSKVKGEG